MSDQDNFEPAPDESPVVDAASPNDTQSQDDSGDSPRRSFMIQFLAAAIGAVVGLIPAITGTLFFLNPLFRKSEKSASDRPDAPVKDADGRLKTPLTVDSLADDGTPQQIKMIDDIVDAWNLFPNQEVGSIWIRKVEGQVIAFNTICPHLGCSIEHRSSQGDFYCPCHLSSFDLDGGKKNEIPPRGMDTLDVNVTDDGSVWVKYETFRGAISEKVTV